MIDSRPPPLLRTPKSSRIRNILTYEIFLSVTFTVVSAISRGGAVS